MNRKQAKSLWYSESGIMAWFGQLTRGSNILRTFSPSEVQDRGNIWNVLNVQTSKDGGAFWRLQESQIGSHRSAVTDLGGLRLGEARKGQEVESHRWGGPISSVCPPAGGFSL